MTRQQEWQDKQKKAGNCVVCGKLRVPESKCYCKKHMLIQRKRVNERQQRRKNDQID